MPRINDLTNQRFGRLIAVEHVYTAIYRSAKRRGFHHRWRCICDCGNETEAFEYNLKKSNHTTSCGCFHKDRVSETKTTHGQTNTKLYRIWNNMRRRCGDPANHAFHHYGGRGITVYEAWHDFATFAADVGPHPGNGLTLDRIDNDGNYEPGNVRWATWKQQAANKRKRKS